MISNNIRFIVENEIRKQILLEDKASDNRSKARAYYKDKTNQPDITLQEYQTEIESKIVSSIPKVKGADFKFMVGVMRLWLDGQLDDDSKKNKFNKCLGCLIENHANDYDSNLRSEEDKKLMSADEIINRFETVHSNSVKDDLEKTKNMVVNGKSDYDIVRIDTFEEASRYSEDTDWCITKQESYFNRYTQNGVCQFYFCLKHGFESLKKPKECDGNPLDEYGLSMIAVSISPDGGINTCTCRWNHANNGNDSVFKTNEELKAVLNLPNYSEIIKPVSKEEVEANRKSAFDKVYNELKKELDSGKSLEELCDKHGPYYVYDIDYEEHIILKQDGSPFIERVFSFIGKYSDGFIPIELNNKCNLLKEDGTFLSDEWFEGFGDFSEGFAIVKTEEDWNFIDKNGELLSDEWFKSCGNFREGFAQVKTDKGWNLIDRNGKLISKEWFKLCFSFSYGFAVVETDKGFNFIDKNGKFLSNEWFKWCTSFKNGFAEVKTDKGRNFLKEDGTFLSDEWFEYCYDFINGFARVRTDKGYNFIDKNGKLLSNIWFKDCYDFRRGFAYIKIDKGWQYLDTNGNLYDKKPTNESRLVKLVMENVIRILKKR